MDMTRDIKTRIYHCLYEGSRNENRKATGAFWSRNSVIRSSLHHLMDMSDPSEEHPKEHVRMASLDSHVGIMYNV